MEWSKKDWLYEKWFGAWSGQRTSLIPNFKPSFCWREEIIATKPSFVNKNLSETSSEEHNESIDESERWVWTDLMIANWMILMLKTSRAMMVHLEKFSKLQNPYCKKPESSHTLSWEIRKKIKSSKHRLITWAALTKRCVYFFGLPYWSDYSPSIFKRLPRISVQVIFLNFNKRPEPVKHPLSQTPPPKKERLMENCLNKMGAYLKLLSSYRRENKIRFLGSMFYK